MADALDCLSDEDVVMLQAKAYEFEVNEVGGTVHLVLKNYHIPEHYTPQTVELLLQLPPNFPTIHPDMFWMTPEVRRSDNGAYPVNADQFYDYGGRRWQRWSRHLIAERWRPGTDCLQTYLGTIKRELKKGA
jgi:hypothetical protein